MRALLFLGIIIFASGCIEAGLQPAVAGVAKALPEAKSFLNEYPEATMKTALYSPISIKAVLEEFKKDCPELGQEGKSYFKVSITDEPSGREMIMWLDTKDNSMVCAVRTTTAVRAETTTTAPPAITTETSGPAATQPQQTAATTGPTTAPPTTLQNATTTIASATTSTISNASTTTAATLENATTTTIGGATTTTTGVATTTTATGATTTAGATTTSSTTTTTTALPDLLVQSIVVFKTSATSIHMDITVKNGGSAASLAQTFGKVFTPAGTTQSNSFTIPAMAAGETKVFTVAITSSYISPPGSYTSEISLDHGDLYVRESNENNNKQSISYVVPMTADVTWP